MAHADVTRAPTLVEMMRQRAELTPDQQYFHLFDETVTYERLWTRPALTVIALEASPIKGSSNQIVDSARARVSVRIVPNHSCLTVAQFDEYAVVRGDEVLDRWKIWRGRD